MPSVGSGRYSPGPGTVKLLEDGSYQEIRPPVASCSLIRPDFLAIDSIFRPLTIPRTRPPCRRRSRRTARPIHHADISVGGLPWIKTRDLGRIAPRPHRDPARRLTSPAGP